MLIPSPSSSLSTWQLPHLTRPTGQLHATPPIQSGLPARRTPHVTHAASTAIHGHPGPSWPPRCLAIRARPTPHPGPSLPAAPRITPSPLANWSIPFAKHARNSPRAPDACLAWPPRPTGAPAQRGRPSCVQTFCGPKVIRGGRPPAHRVLATVSRGQLVNGPWTRTRARTASLP